MLSLNGTGNSKVFGYIHDGNTEPAFFYGVHGFYPDVNFKYRRMLRVPQQRLILEGALSYQSSRAIGLLQHVYAQLISEHVVEWDLEKSDNVLVPLDRDEILNVDTNLFQRFVDLMLGEKPADVRPTHYGVSDNIGRSDPQAILHATLDGTSVEEALAKN